MLVVSSNKDKYHYSCKLVHELAANVYEMFKEVDRRHNLRMSHFFSISKTDFNCEPMELTLS